MNEQVETEDKDKKLPAMERSLRINWDSNVKFYYSFQKKKTKNTCFTIFFQNDDQGLDMENEIENEIQNDIEQKWISEFGQTESRGGQEGGTMLILYCIPAIILSVLIVLAWRNYRGKIRVKLSSMLIYL